METRAHHLLVGSFVIIVVLGLLGFVIVDERKKSLA